MIFRIDITYKLVELWAWSWWKLRCQLLFGQKVRVVSMVDSVHTFVFSFSKLNQVIACSCVIWVSDSSCVFKSTGGCVFALCFWRLGSLLDLAGSCTLFALCLDLMIDLLVSFGFSRQTLSLCFLAFFLSTLRFRLFLSFILFVFLLLLFDRFPLLKLIIFCFCVFLTL
jgi:hypothetical protein